MTNYICPNCLGQVDEFLAICPSCGYNLYVQKEELKEKGIIQKAQEQTQVLEKESIEKKGLSIGCTDLIGCLLIPAWGLIKSLYYYNKGDNIRGKLYLNLSGISIILLIIILILKDVGIL